MKRTTRRRKNRTRRQRRSHKRTKKYRSMRGGMFEAVVTPLAPAPVHVPGSYPCWHIDRISWVSSNDTKKAFIERIDQNNKLSPGQMTDLVERQILAMEHIARKWGAGHFTHFNKLKPIRLGEGGIISGWYENCNKYLDEIMNTNKVLTGESRKNYILTLASIMSYGLNPFEPQNWISCLNKADPESQVEGADRQGMPGEKDGWTEPTFEDLSLEEQGTTVTE